MKSLKFSTLFIVALVFLFSACNRNVQRLKKPQDGFMVGFYNLENLFDTIDDPAINDEEFLPESKLKWDSKKYAHKLENMARVIASMDSLDYPHFLGFAEVENESALKDLKDHPKLHDAAYEMIHVADSDPRGIEVAAFYRPEYMKVLRVNTLKTIVGNEEQRHILYIKGLIAWGDTLHLFVNHWTSRYGGLEATKDARNGTAAFLKKHTDSIFSKIPDANILIMGDFNDNPEDKSMTRFLKAQSEAQPARPDALYNLSLEPHARGEGTLYYKSWDFFDQIIVSGALINPEGLHCKQIVIVKKPWMLFKTPQGVERPNRTQSNGKFFGGYSDHLPVMVRLKRNK